VDCAVGSAHSEVRDWKKLTDCQLTLMKLKNMLMLVHTLC